MHHINTTECSGTACTCRTCIALRMTFYDHLPVTDDWLCSRIAIRSHDRKGDFEEQGGARTCPTGEHSIPDKGGGRIHKV